MIDIRIGDSRDHVHGLDDNSIDCVMTSPPYWGLRDYGHPDQIGAEPTPEQFLDNLVGLFSNIKDKLKPSGNCFVNLGDTYARSGSADNYNDQKVKGRNHMARDEGVSPKCLCMIPERFAWRMIESGWILRNKIIWYKPNHMPESVTDRLTKSYEVVYHFVKSQKYYYDLDAIREPHKYVDKTGKRIGGKGVGPIKKANQLNPNYDGKFNNSALNPESTSSTRARTQREGYEGNENHPLGKNPGDVWHINTKPYSKAHFAVYPLELVRKPILAGCPVGGVVLDPFGGSGTTAEFCRKNQRDCITFELNPEYEPLIKERSMSSIPSLDAWVVA